MHKIKFKTFCFRMILGLFVEVSILGCVSEELGAQNDAGGVVDDVASETADSGVGCGDDECNGAETIDAGAEGFDDAGVGNLLTYTCTSIGTSHGDGFFELESFNGHLYAGAFGYGLEDQSMLFRYPEWELTSPGLLGIGESVCALFEFEGALYANTENSGDIFVSEDGSNWTRSYDGPAASIGCGLAEFKDDLYAINYQNGSKTHGRVLRMDEAGWTQVYDSDQSALYLRELVTYNDTLYAFGVQDEQGQMLTSTDGTQWTKTRVANRYLRSHVYNGYLWLGSTNFSSPESEVGVFRFDGEDFVQKHQGNKRYVTEIKDLNGVLFAGTSNGWKAENGPSSLLMSADDGESWETICTFAETAVWDLAVHNGELYLGTWQWEDDGHVMHVVVSDEPPPDIPDPLDDECTPQAGTLAVGETKTVEIDAFSGDEHTTQPKTDANDGLNGDNPNFRRHNVARAHNDYWYSSAHQEADEPDPSGEQWIDYTPDFAGLGVGCYRIIGQYRATENRAGYLVDYQTRNTAAGDFVYQEAQERGEGEYRDVEIGTHPMCSDSSVRVQDPGSLSISFHKMRFIYLGATCP